MSYACAVIRTDVMDAPKIELEIYVFPLFAETVLPSLSPPPSPPPQGGGGAKSYDRDKAWPPINHSILSGAKP
jgi:hypothetical protein